MNKALKIVGIAGILIIALSISYYFVIFLPKKTFAEQTVKNSPTSTSSLEAISCRAYTWVQAPLPTVAGTLRPYFKNVITDNASLSDLQTIELGLNVLKQQAINTANSYASGASDPFASENSGAAFTPAELDAMQQSNASMMQPVIDYYSAWITITKKIIQDKQANGCINVNDYNNYIVQTGIN